MSKQAEYFMIKKELLEIKKILESLKKTIAIMVEKVNKDD
tara:strand:+ start:508 stop:627 length:120 start_codon:yes stop_codon:yes gene_type:complete